MKKLASLLGISALVIAAGCGGGEEAGADAMMEGSEPPSQGMDAGGMMADTMMADTMAADTMMDEGMPEEMMDEGGGMSDDEMGGGG